MIVYFIHFNKSPQQGRSISTESHAALFTLSIAAIERTKTNCPGFITDGLLRVDIFKNKDGKYVVNEFESLDADYYGASSSHLKTCQTSSFSYESRRVLSILAQADREIVLPVQTTTCTSMQQKELSTAQ